MLQYHISTIKDFSDLTLVANAESTMEGKSLR